MSAPFTRETCCICGVTFDVPMESRRGRGPAWHVGSARLLFDYSQDPELEIDLDPACRSCAAAVAESAARIVDALKQAKTTR
jgi:hypothetical protein